MDAFYHILQKIEARAYPLRVNEEGLCGPLHEAAWRISREGQHTREEEEGQHGFVVYGLSC